MFRHLAPAKAEAGFTWEVPEAVGRQFSRVLGPGDENTIPLRTVDNASLTRYTPSQPSRRVCRGQRVQRG